jgi:hypothetical protein
MHKLEDDETPILKKIYTFRVQEAQKFLLVKDWTASKAAFLH